jgi:Peroxiredoxin
MQDYYEPKVGDRAPDFKLPASTGGEISLYQFRGKNVILYFYPKDDTPGCTAEACSLRDVNTELQKAGAVVLGVSTGSVESKQKFSQKYKLNFPLLADQTADVAKMYGAWKQKNLYGRQSWGVARTTYLIGPDARVKKIYKKVKTDSHGADILEELKGGK